MTGSLDNYYTVDELSGLVKLPRRTIRYYQTQGMLRPPHRIGRLAVYDDEHAKRLRLITSMQERGLRLDAIRAVLDRMESGGGDSLVAWLGLTGRDTALGPEDRPMLLTTDAMLARIDGDRALLDDLVRFHVVHRQGGALSPVYLVRSLALLDDAVALARVGVDLAISVGAAEIIRSHLETMVDRLIAELAARIHDNPEYEDDRSLQQALDALRGVAFGVVRTMFAQEMERALQALIEGGPAALTQRAPVVAPTPMPAVAPTRR